MDRRERFWFWRARAPQRGRRVALPAPRQPLRGRRQSQTGVRGHYETPTSVHVQAQQLLAQPDHSCRPFLLNPPASDATPAQRVRARGPDRVLRHVCACSCSCSASCSCSLDSCATALALSRRAPHRSGGRRGQRAHSDERGRRGQELQGAGRAHWQGAFDAGPCVRHSDVAHRSVGCIRAPCTGFDCHWRRSGHMHRALVAAAAGRRQTASGPARDRAIFCTRASAASGHMRMRAFRRRMTTMRTLDNINI